MPSRCGPLCDSDGASTIDGGCGRYSAAFGALLPSLGARSGRRPRLRWFIVSPYCPPYCIWDWENSMIALVVYSAFGCPPSSSASSAIPPVRSSPPADNAVDIVPTFFLAHSDKRTYLLQDDPSKIAWRYATTWLALDIASTVPTQLSRRILPPQARSDNFFGMLCLRRLRRVGARFA